MDKQVTYLLCLRHHRAEALSDAFVWRLSVWRLSVGYIGPNSRTERPRKIKIGTEVAHVIQWLGHHFQGQKVKGQPVADNLNSQHAATGATWRINTKEDNVNLQGAEAYRGGRPPTACLTYALSLLVEHLTFLVSFQLSLVLAPRSSSCLSLFPQLYFENLQHAIYIPDYKTRTKRTKSSLVYFGRRLFL